MIRQMLQENWTVNPVGSRERLPATVPGSVYADLLNNGKLEDLIGGIMSLPP